METDMSEYQGSASAKSPSDVHAMESGFFNKYAIDEADPRKGDPADPKTVILHEAYLDASRDIGNIETEGIGRFSYDPSTGL